MTPAEIDALRPKASTSAAITEALARLASAQNEAEAARAEAVHDLAVLLKTGATAKDRRAAEDREADATFNVRQLDVLAEELAEALNEAQDREAAAQSETARQAVRRDADAHRRRWEADLPSAVRLLEGLLIERRSIVQRATLAGIAVETADLVPDLSPPIEYAPAIDGWAFPATAAMRAEKGAAQAQAAADRSAANAVADAQDALRRAGLPAWPEKGRAEAGFRLGLAGRQYFVRGAEYAGGEVHRIPWPEAVMLAAAALPGSEAMVEHPVVGWVSLRPAKAVA